MVEPRNQFLQPGKTLLWEGAPTRWVHGWPKIIGAPRRIRPALGTRGAYIATSRWTQSLESYPILPGTALGLEKGRHAGRTRCDVLIGKDSDGDRSTSRISFENIAGGGDVLRLFRSIQIGTA